MYSVITEKKKNGVCHNYMYMWNQETTQNNKLVENCGDILEFGCILPYMALQYLCGHYWKHHTVFNHKLLSIWPLEYVTMLSKFS